MRNRSLKEIGRILDCPTEADVSITHFGMDSRTVRPGELYFALQGAKVDGHSFLGEVEAKGAKAAVVRKNFQNSSVKLPLLRVEDPLLALQQLAKRAVADSPKRKIIGVTGSVGKTTTKEFLVTLLEKDFAVGATPGNHNSQITLPLTLLNETSGEEDLLVLEMGMSHPGNIRQLIEIAPPDIALLTAVTLQHAVNFASLDEIARAKAEIFTHPKTKSFLPLEWQALQPHGTTFSTRSKEAAFHLTLERGQLLLNGTLPLGPFHLLGDHRLHNLAGAIAVAKSLGMTDERLRERIPHLKIVPGRGTFIEKRGVLFIHDAYNAGPASVMAALDAFPETAGRKIAVLGEMRELGSFSQQAHLEVGHYALDRVDVLYCLGDTWKEVGEDPAVFWTTNREELHQKLQQDLKPGDVVLVKGSRSTQMWEAIDTYDLSTR